MSRLDIECQMFPAAFWFTRFSSWKPFWKGSDEWGRHTLLVGIPFLVHVVIPTKPCDCDEMTAFRCAFPGCPYMGIATDSMCQTHDVEFWREEVAS